MIKNYLIAFVCIVLIIKDQSFAAADPNLDSLIIKLETSTSLDEKYHVALEIAVGYREKRLYLKYEYFALKMLELAESIGNPDYIADAHFQYAKALGTLRKTEKSLEHYLFTKRLYEELGRELDIAYCNHNIGNQLVLIGYCDEAIPYLNEARKLYNEKQLYSSLIKSSNLLTRVYYEKKNFTESMKYNDITLDYAKLINDSLNYAKALNSRGIIYYYKGEFETSRKYYREYMNHLNPKKNYYYNQLRIGNGNIGETFREQGDFKNAKLYFDKAIALKDLAPNLDFSYTHVQLGKLYILEDKIPMAIEEFEKAFQVLQHKSFSKLKNECLNQLNNAYQLKRNKDSIDYSNIIKLNSILINNLDSISIQAGKTLFLRNSENDELISNTIYLREKTQQLQAKSKQTLLVTLGIIIGLLALVYYREQKFRRLVKSWWEDVNDV